MSYANTLKMFEILRQKFHEPEAKIIATAVEKAIETNNHQLLENIATKKDISGLRVEMTALKAELIKWMFILWVGQFASITTVLFLFFKK